MASDEVVDNLMRALGKTWGGGMKAKGDHMGGEVCKRCGTALIPDGEKRNWYPSFQKTSTLICKTCTGKPNGAVKKPGTSANPRAAAKKRASTRTAVAPIPEEVERGTPVIAPHEFVLARKLLGIVVELLDRIPTEA